jgi:hypothetical protein
MYASDAANSTERPASSVTVDTRATEGDGVKEGMDGEVESVETESEDENPTATARYWELKRKKDGVHKVNHVL